MYFSETLIKKTTKIFTDENAFENGICKMVAVLSQIQYVKAKMPMGMVTLWMSSKWLTPAVRSLILLTQLNVVQQI